MKKIFTLFTLSFLATFSFAQITITNADMPVANDTIRLSETNDIQGLDPVLTGANFSWNFSTLTPNTQRIDTFVSVSSTPFAYQLFFNNGFQYPDHKASFALRGADIGIPQVPITEVYNYIKNSSSAYDNVGFGSKISGVPSSTQNIPVDREYVFPMNYLNNDSSFSRFSVSVPGFGDYGQMMARIDTVDGWGTLTLPNGTYNVLRVKSRILRTDSIYLSSNQISIKTPRPEEIEYKWLTSSKGLPMLKIITSGGNVTQIEYQDDLFVGVEELDILQGLIIYPNPVKNYIIIDFNVATSGKMMIKIKNILGEDVATVYQQKIVSGKTKLPINIAQYNIQSGIYFLEFVMNGETITTQKIIITE